MKRILAVASGGGHFVQLMRLKPAFDGCEVHYVTTNSGYSVGVDGFFHVVTDANAGQKMKLFLSFLQMGKIFLSIRPDAVISTGAAPGLVAIFLGKLFGAKTLWLDSIANSEELSKSGKLARRLADVWLTQWEHLAQSDGPQYWGGVL